jgi:hypothetical protein
VSQDSLEETPLKLWATFTGVLTPWKPDMDAHRKPENQLWIRGHSEVRECDVAARTFPESHYGTKEELIEWFKSRVEQLERAFDTLADQVDQGIPLEAKGVPAKVVKVPEDD